jgi:hypothetical protein
LVAQTKEEVRLQARAISLTLDITTAGDER